MKTLTTTSLFLIYFLIPQICSAQGCTDPEAWNYQNWGEPDTTGCIYLLDCEDGTINGLFNPWLNLYAENAQIYITSLDGADTLAHKEWHFPTYNYSNLMLACMEEGTCYYMDIYLTDSVQSVPGHIEYYTEDNPNMSYFLLPPGPNDFYRSLISTDQNTCGVLGCTDPVALNYWPWATVNYGCQYCEENAIYVTPNYIISGSMSWHIEQNGEYITGGSFDEFPGDTIAELDCITDGCYELVLAGDAWYFSSISIEYNGDTLVTASLTQNGEVRAPFSVNAEPCGSSQEIYGCTNPLGMNYNPQATIDDGSCDLQNDNCNLDIEMYQDSITDEIHFDVDIYSEDYPIYIYWDFGDGSPISDDWWSQHTYDSAGTYEVCATLYTTMFFEQLPLCYDQTCMTLNTDDFGIQGGFPLFLDGDGTGVEDISKNDILLLSPNPVKDKLQCSIPKNGNLKTIKIYSLDGRLVKSFSNLNSDNDPVIISVAPLSKGTYIIFAQSADEKFFTGRFIKM